MEHIYTWKLSNDLEYIYLCPFVSWRTFGSFHLFMVVNDTAGHTAVCTGACSSPGAFYRENSDRFHLLVFCLGFCIHVHE